MPPFLPSPDHLLWQSGYEILCIQPWGPDRLRVRATTALSLLDQPWALLDPLSAQVEVHIEEDRATITNGKILAQISAGGQVRFMNAETGALLLEEEPHYFYRPPPRGYRPREGDLYRLEARFSPQEGERFYGLGQHANGRLDQKGCIIELVQRNTEVCIPFLLSSRGYGFLWNNPAVGQVELGLNGTRWVAEAARQFDYLVIAGDTPREILSHYADCTGHTPLLPEWAAGLWQSKYRYRTQEELLEVAREYRRRNLPLSVLVIDWFFTTAMGDWDFNPQAWPDPAAMVRELQEQGVQVMVSVWPTVTPESKNYEPMKKAGLLVRTSRGHPIQMILPGTPYGTMYLHFYDATHPEARRYHWQEIERNYLSQGIKVFWLDACEPEIYPQDHDHLRYALGGGLEVSSLYPWLHQKGYRDGFEAAGVPDGLMLSRSAWAGSQRFGTAVWSGDIHSTFESLQAQVRAGLNMGLSGIPWWTTDIGGFLNGDIFDPAFHELLVRWFQYGCFCPIFRLHGARLPIESSDTCAPNEPWSYGEEVYRILESYIHLRERLRPYLMDQMRLAHKDGIPVMRPLFFDFPTDEGCFPVEDEFMFGPDLLVAPILHAGDREREAYLPAGVEWVDAWTGAAVRGGSRVPAAAPLDRIPLYLRAASPLLDIFRPGASNI